VPPWVLQVLFLVRVSLTVMRWVLPAGSPAATRHYIVMEVSGGTCRDARHAAEADGILGRPQGSAAIALGLCRCSRWLAGLSMCCGGRSASFSLRLGGLGASTTGSIAIK
jgi:hypothetical protein